MKYKIQIREVKKITGETHADGAAVVNRKLPRAQKN